MKSCAKMLVVLLLALQLMTGITSNAETGNIQTILSDFGIVEYQGKQFALSSSNSLTSTYQIPSGETIILNSDGQLQSIFRTNLLSEKYGKATNSPAISNEQLITKLDELVAKKYIPSEFVLESQNDYDIGFREYVYLEKADNVVNPYNAVKIAFDSSTGELIYYNRIHLYTLALKAEISQEMARKSLEEYINSEQIEINNVEFVGLRIENNSLLTLLQGDETSYSLVYQFKATKDDGYTIFSVDAITGTVVSRDDTMAYEYKAQYVYEQNNYTDILFVTIASHTSATFNQLGYTGGTQKVTNRQQILTHLAGVNSWGFGFSGHGDSNRIGANQPTAFYVNRTEVTGIWSLVILHACDTANNDAWANAFQIYAGNTLGRAFIGWNETVLITKLLNFSNHFRNAVRDYPNSSLLSNVYTAIANIPGTDVYWVRYIGDPNTTGRK